MGELKIALLAGAESKEFLRGLTAALDRLEKLLARAEGLTVKAAPKINKDEDEEDETPKSKTKAKAKKVAPPEEGDSDDDDDSDSVSDDADDDDDAEDDSDDDRDDDDSESVDVSDEDDDEDDEDDEDEAPKPKKAKAAKAKKVTSDDCNDIAKKLVKVTDRDTVYKLMKKHFKTKSIAELKPEQYAKFVEVVKAAIEEAEGDE